MSFSTTNGTVAITLPTIPYLSSYPFSVTIPTSALRTLLRLVVIIATYLLFRPHLERLFRTVTGGDDPNIPRSVEGMKNRMREIETERAQPIGGGRKLGIATGSGSAAVGGQGSAQKARRKA